MPRSFSSGPLVTLQFKHGAHLDVHRALLLRHPKLLALAGDQFSSIEGRSPPEVAPLKNTSRSAGHVLVHYLYTGTYGTLKWVGTRNGCEERAAKLKTGFEVYAAARKYELVDLEDLAKAQISFLSKDLDAFAIVAVVNEVYPMSTDDDTWFPGFMKTVVKTAFKDPTALLEFATRKSLWGGAQGGFSTVVTLLGSALEAYREIAKDGSAEAAPSQLTDDASEWLTATRKEKRKGGHYRYCTWNVAQELVKLVPGEPASTEDAAPQEVLPTADEAEPAMETWAEAAALEEPCSQETGPQEVYPESTYPEEAYPQGACAEAAIIVAETPPEEIVTAEGTERLARPNPTLDNIFGSFNPSNMNKADGKRERRRKSVACKKPCAEDWPEESEPTPEPERNSIVVFGNATDSGFFSGTSSTGFMFSFRPTDKAASDDISSTTNSAFTPTTEQESSFQP